MKPLSLCCAVLCCLAAAPFVRAQIPNPGFETWSLGTPTGWLTNNAPGVDTTIVRTTDAHSGTYAAQGIATAFATATFAPTLSALFTWTTASTTFSGYYKYSPVGGDSLIVAAVFAKNSKAIAVGVLRTTTAAAAYTPFSIPMTYLAAGVPDSGGIDIAIIPGVGSSSVHVGSTFTVDDLSFSGVTGVAQEVATTPQSYALGQNFPNPFNPTTVINYSIPGSGQTTLTVYDLLGREVQTLVNEYQNAGTYSFSFDASKLTSGVYYYRLQSGSFTQTKKLMLVK